MRGPSTETQEAKRAALECIKVTYRRTCIFLGDNNIWVTGNRSINMHAALAVLQVTGDLRTERSYRGAYLD